jgi:ribulose kinase
VTGFPVAVPAVLETAVLGSAILAAVGTSAYEDIPSAIRAMTAIAERIQPRPDNAAVYDKAFGAYVGLYPATAPLLRPLTKGTV